LFFSVTSTDKKWVPLSTDLISGKRQGHREPGLENRVGAQAQLCCDQLKTASQTKRCGLAHCLGAKSNRFSIILVVSFSRVRAISSRLQSNTADLLSGHFEPTVITIPRILKKTINTALNFKQLLFFFLGGGVVLGIV
jgi:hypothetical protein